MVRGGWWVRGVGRRERRGEPWRSVVPLKSVEASTHRVPPGAFGLKTTLRICGSPPRRLSSPAVGVIWKSFASPAAKPTTKSSNEMTSFETLIS